MLMMLTFASFREGCKPLKCFCLKRKQNDFHKSCLSEDMLALTTGINFLLAPYSDECHAVEINMDEDQYIHVKT